MIEAYAALTLEYQLAGQTQEGRSLAGLPLDAVAERMGTTEGAVSRLESAGKHAPSLATLIRNAETKGCELQVSLVPRKPGGTRLVDSGFLGRLKTGIKLGEGIMAKYRKCLPQISGGLYLTDGGIETSMIFLEGFDLPDFAAFHLLGSAEGEAALQRYFCKYAEIARRFKAGLILESATWRSSADWGARLGYTREALADANRKAIQLLEDVREQFETEQTPVVISGCIGPRGDGYVAGHTMTEEEAETYHRAQVDLFAASEADMVCAITLNYAAEAVGIVRAAQQADMPAVISFTVETDGRLPTGQSLKAAIEYVDETTAAYPAYYMINCAHPSHFEQAFEPAGAWLERIRGLRANASRKSHAELNESPDLDIGDPDELGAQYLQLTTQLSRLNVMGGCCGTDHRHVEKIARSCSSKIRVGN